MSQRASTSLLVGEQDAFAGPHAADFLGQRFEVYGRDAGERLVEEGKIRVGVQQQQHFQPPRGTAREFFHRPVLLLPEQL
ncbi:hypothetical protein KLP40_11455 [Hymenobacter sp. NST-14]|uniref:hypothetical protein n=1 Tax=Hymenobacter piscis TaxID=2839984 RepID=UPI001C00C4AE|nr:hypothetical protein [Hymenobacter piscis]MBT9393780.1 hypothetical protein [Hymenobacter piscis]